VISRPGSTASVRLTISAPNRGQPGVPSRDPAAVADHLAELGGDPRAARRRHVGIGGVPGGQVAGERGEIAEGFGDVDGVEPFRVLGAGQAARGHRAAEHRRGMVPVGVRGPQFVPGKVAGRPDRSVIGHASHRSVQDSQTRYISY
jgi:hypothetical protein